MIHYIIYNIIYIYSTVAQFCIKLVLLEKRWSMAERKKVFWCDATFQLSIELPKDAPLATRMCRTATRCLSKERQSISRYS